ncbi:MAG: TIGR01841 family phasin [Alphaproteobacteria bacterium]|nr:TIGR01841 family phasin [Alphaproteobacteria bacterium]
MAQANAFNDIFKLWSDWKLPAATEYTTKAVKLYSKSGEFATEAGRLVSEDAQAILRRQAAVAQSAVEDILQTSRELFTGGSPETGAAKIAELTKSLFERGLSHLREATEMVTKSNTELYDLCNKQAKEVLEEASKVVASASKK